MCQSLPVPWGGVRGGSQAGVGRGPCHQNRDAGSDKVVARCPRWPAGSPASALAPPQHPLGLPVPAAVVGSEGHLHPMPASFGFCQQAGLSAFRLFGQSGASRRTTVLGAVDVFEAAEHPDLCTG